jgi:hypothetical protein
MLITSHALGHATYFSKPEIQNLPPSAQRFCDPDSEWFSPGLINREVKTRLIALLNESVHAVLSKLQSILRGSSANPKWLGAFMCMLGLAFAIDELQSTTESVAEMVWKYEGIMPKVGVVTPETAGKANQAIDDAFIFMTQLFGQKYKNFKPLVDSAMADKLGADAMRTVREIRRLCRRECKFSSMTVFLQLTIDQMAITFQRSNTK